MNAIYRSAKAIYLYIYICIYSGIDIIHSLFSSFQLNKIAKKHVKEWLANRTSTLYDGYGTNYYQMPFEGVDKLDAAKIVSNWFETMFNYYRQNQPTNPNVTSKFIVLYY